MMQTSLPLVTVAIPTYNRGDSYLRQALECGLNQTYPNFELIVADNCSSDNTRTVVTRISDRRLRYFRHDVNIDANSNFNFCFDQAKGAFVLLLHDDDMIDNDFVEACIEAAAGNFDVGIIRTGTRLIDAEGDVMREVPNTAAGLSTEAFFRAWFSGRTAIYMCSTLFNTKRLREIGGFESRYHCYQDAMATVRLAAKYGRLDVADVKASFRIHKGEMGFGRKITDWCEDSLALLNLMSELVPESKDQILKEGRQFFSRANYGRASKANSPSERLICYLKVLKYFDYRYPPSARHVLHVFSGTRAFNAVRAMKRKLQYVSSSA